MDIDQTRKRLLSLVATGKERGIGIQYDSPQSILTKLAEKDSWLLKEILPVLLGTTHATVESATLVAQRSPECGLYKAMILSNIDNSYQNIVLPALEQAIPSGRLIFFTYFLIQYAALYDLVRGAVDAQILPALTRDGEIVVFPTTFIPWAQGKGYIVPRTLRNITTPCNIRKTPEEYLMILREQGKIEWNEKKFFDINKSRELAQTALHLDQNFEQARNLTSELDKIHESFALLQSENILKMGKMTLLIAEAFHSQVLNILSTSNSISKTYSAIKPHLDVVQKMISPWRESMEESMKLIATYKGSRSNEYFTIIKEYFHIVQFGVEALLVPSGNLIQFRQAGNDTLQKFSSVQVKLTSSRPNSASLHESFAGFSKALGDYKIFKNPRTEKVIDSFSNLYTL